MVSSAVWSRSASAAARESRSRSKRCTEAFGVRTELMTMTERDLEEFAVGDKLSRRSLVTRATFFGAAMAAIGDVAKAQDAGSGSYSSAAIALPDSSVAAKSRDEQIRAVRIARAMRAGPSVITEHATVAE